MNSETFFYSLRLVNGERVENLPYDKKVDHIYYQNKIKTGEWYFSLDRETNYYHLKNKNGDWIKTDYSPDRADFEINRFKLLEHLLTKDTKYYDSRYGYTRSVKKETLQVEKAYLAKRMCFIEMQGKMLNNGEYDVYQINQIYHSTYGEPRITKINKEQVSHIYTYDDIKLGYYFIKKGVNSDPFAKEVVEKVLSDVKELIEFEDDFYDESETD
ncbi:hypothetical protein H9M94_03110 [Mycoplasma sp. Pen4]|uniref:hypothetical protein n=1 Tax=Mycoplasma sp. Pen4 TaxID=640330 RepID=UPI0016548E53|nr:hypothetical protein [Mycoplasma sp. Pen4]QNM93463.1 hypothetical protein H9M94_02530 [Mycoplasma sp. Pen4]QNM93517.1 hypothetical protein H9M94_02810 [Mycoplasma sp. Pen4]QNM93569.1 hypothetical protein H9M94_03110 [Mycoplasma sp. Pen4]